MEMITSPQNEWVAQARKLKQKKYREDRGAFLAEGLRLSEEAAKAGVVEEVFYHESLADTARGEILLKQLAAKTKHFYKVSAKIVNTLAETETPQGIVCVCKVRKIALKDFQPDNGPILVADGIQDPGNLGAILRTLWAAGGQALFCLKGTTDPYGGKCVRASMGGVFHAPVFADIDWQTTVKWALARGYAIVAADSSKGVDYRKASWREKTILCVGSEALGLNSIPEEDIDEYVHIPLAKDAESLNAAVAAGILIFESVRSGLVQ